MVDRTFDLSDEIGSHSRLTFVVPPGSRLRFGSSSAKEMHGKHILSPYCGAKTSAYQLNDTFTGLPRLRFELRQGHSFLLLM